MQEELNQIIEKYNFLTEPDELIFIDLLEDILKFDTSIKKEVKKDFAYDLDKSYYDELALIFNSEIKKLGKTNEENSQIFNQIGIEFKESLFGNANTNNEYIYSLIPTYKKAGFNLCLEELMGDKFIDIESVGVKRKTFLHGLHKANIIQISNKESELNQLFSSFIEELETDIDNPLLKLRKTILDEKTLIYGEDIVNKDLEVILKLDIYTDYITYKREDIQTLLDLLVGKQDIKLYTELIGTSIRYKGDTLNFSDGDKPLEILQELFKKKKDDGIYLDELFEILYGNEFKNTENHKSLMKLIHGVKTGINRRFRDRFRLKGTKNNFLVIKGKRLFRQL